VSSQEEWPFGCPVERPLFRWLRAWGSTASCGILGLTSGIAVVVLFPFTGIASLLGRPLHTSLALGLAEAVMVLCITASQWSRLAPLPSEPATASGATAETARGRARRSRVLVLAGVGLAAVPHVLVAIVVLVVVTQTG